MGDDPHGGVAHGGNDAHAGDDAHVGMLRSGGNFTLPTWVCFH